MKNYAQYVEKHRQLILDAEDYLWKNPETGYREWKTHAYLEEAYAKLGYELTLAGDIPGFTAEVDTGIPGPTVAVFGELDSMLCQTHPEADPATGAVHACGHCAQSAALLGIAAALKEPGVLDGLCGKIRLVAVPAEELIEVEQTLTAKVMSQKAAKLFDLNGRFVDILRHSNIDRCQVAVYNDYIKFFFLDSETDEIAESIKYDYTELADEDFLTGEGCFSRLTCMHETDQLVDCIGKAVCRCSLHNR